MCLRHAGSEKAIEAMLASLTDEDEDENVVASIGVVFVVMTSALHHCRETWLWRSRSSSRSGSS